MSSARFNIIEISDIHFGNGRVSPELTYENLTTFLYPLLKDIELLVINGDTFDTMLNMNSDAGFYVGRFINDVVALAEKEKFYIRVVRGTFSHDRHQNRFFLIRGRDELELNGKPIVKVYDAIAIEHFDGFNFLFCPDNLPHKDLTKEVVSVIDSNHLASVDCIFSHGYYAHLLPENLPHIPNDTLEWEKLKSRVSGYAVNGHVHHMSVHDRVISSGSFERFDHSVTEKVGLWRLTFNKKWNATFIENTNSLEFKTFYPTIKDTDDEISRTITEYIDKLISSGYPETKPIYVRLAGHDTGFLENIKTKYPNVVVSVKPIKSVQEDLVSDDDLYEELPIITEDNLADLIYEEIKNSGSLSLKEVRKLIDGL